MALTDQEDNVRLAAINGYKKHPHGGDIRALIDPVYSRQVTWYYYLIYLSYLIIIMEQTSRRDNLRVITVLCRCKLIR